MLPSRLPEGVTATDTWAEIKNAVAFVQKGVKPVTWAHRGLEGPPCHHRLLPTVSALLQAFMKPHGE